MAHVTIWLLGVHILPLTTSQKLDLQAELQEKDNTLFRLQGELNQLQDELQHSRKRLLLQSEKGDHLSAKVTATTSYKNEAVSLVV